MSNQRNSILSSRPKRADQNLGNKGLKIKVAWGNMSKKRATYYQAEIAKGNIRKVSLVQNQETNILEAHLVIDCAPYRSQEKLATAAQVKDKTVSFDLGPSTLAYVSPDTKAQGIIQPSTKLMKQVKRERKNRKRLERKLQRSRQATNPDCYQDDGQYIRGKKITVKSRNYQQANTRLKQSYKDERKLITAWHDNAVSKIIGLGLNIVTEKDTVKQWQEKGYGKSVTLLAPATLKRKIMHESKVFGGQQTELDTYLTWLSQSCICGQRVKKELYERVHSCRNPDCLLHNTPLHRDKYAALLGLWVKELGMTTKKNKKTKLVEQVFNEKLGVKKLLKKIYHTNEHRIIAIELSLIGSLDRNLGKSKKETSEGYQDSMARTGDLEKTEGEKEANTLSKPDCLNSSSLDENDQSGRAVPFNPSYIHGNNQQDIIPPPEQSSGKKRI